MNPSGGRFAFMDASEVARRLKVDRVTLEQWIKAGRLRQFRGVGKESFFRTGDVEALYNELYPAVELAAAVIEDEQESAVVSTPQKAAPVRKQQDPPMRVYLRLQADAKWYDISEEDIHLWFQQLAPEGYERNKRNAQHTIKKLQFLASLIDEAQERQAEQK